MRYNLTFVRCIENSTVTLYGRGFIKYNVAVWCGFSFNETYRLGLYLIGFLLLMSAGKHETPVNPFELQCLCRGNGPKEESFTDVL